MKMKNKSREKVLSERLNIPVEVVKRVDEIGDDVEDVKTKIVIAYRKDEEREYEIDKAFDEIDKDDIDVLRAKIKYDVKKHPIMGKVYRFFGMWIAFAGVYGLTTACPICGQPGCAVGLTGAGIVGGVAALILQNWRHFIKTIYRKLFKKHV